jgi:diacylglycerol O-acyltransferase / wax synthase
VERLSAQDLSTLWPDDVGWPQDIGVLAILDGSRLLDSDGRFRIEAVRAAIEGRLHLVRRFRQLLYMPRSGLGWPLWVDAPTFDLSDHVRVFPLPKPADEAQLLRATEHLRRRRLDRSRPLWEMWFLPGLSGDRIGMFMKVHHAIADGVAGVATLGAFLVPTAADAPVQPWTPAAAPSARDLFEDNLRRRVDTLGRALSTLVRPVTALRHVRDAWPALHETFAEERAPRTSLNRPIGPDRRLAVIRSNVDRAGEIATANSATINDVLMAAVAGGLHELLRGRGEHVEDLVLRAYVPVSLRQGQRGRAEGNLDGMMVVPLPIGVLDPVRRLRLIAAETTERKKRNRPEQGRCCETAPSSSSSCGSWLINAGRTRMSPTCPARRCRSTSPERRCSRCSRWCPSPETSRSVSVHSPTRGSSTSLPSPIGTPAPMSTSSPRVSATRCTNLRHPLS